jgi:hypothetical protein
VLQGLPKVFVKIFMQEIPDRHEAPPEIRSPEPAFSENTRFSPPALRDPEPPSFHPPCECHILLTSTGGEIPVFSRNTVGFSPNTVKKCKKRVIRGF